jgi:BASS family bile acid:Na+ symporter
VVPALAVVLTRGLHLSSDVAVALLLVAASPGGRFAPHLARVAHGDVAVATQQTAILTKLAVLSAPLSATWLLRLHLVEIPVLRIIVHGCLLQILPLTAGQALGRARPAVAARIERPLRVGVAIAAIAALCALLNASGVSSLRLLGDRGWLAVASLALTTLALGWLVGGPSPLRRRAIAVGGMSHNLALALLLAHVAAPNGHAQLAVFGVWWIFVGVSFAFALVVAQVAAP